MSQNYSKADCLTTGDYAQFYRDALNEKPASDDPGHPERVATAYKRMVQQFVIDDVRNRIYDVSAINAGACAQSRVPLK